MNPCLTTCRACCKFAKDEIYFAPKITKEEIERLKTHGFYKKIFTPFKKSKNIFQIDLKKSKFEKDTFVCPYLDEKTQKCQIYKFRPFDCGFWPFILMRGKNKKDIFIAHFEKDICPITAALPKAKFKKYLEASLKKWTHKKNIAKLIKKYPDLIWDYESDVFVITKLF